MTPDPNRHARMPDVSRHGPPRRQRWRFTLASVIWSVALTAIVFGGWFGWFRITGGYLPDTELHQVLFLVACDTPLFLPIGFLGYCIGRRSVSGLTVITLGVAEAAA